MVNRQQAAERFAHDVMERMRGVSLTPAVARELKGAIDVRTKSSGPLHDVAEVLRGQQLEPDEANAIMRFINDITRRPFSMKVSAEDAERFNHPHQDARIISRVDIDRGDFPRGKTISYGPALVPGDAGYIAPPVYRKLGDNPQA